MSDTPDELAEKRKARKKPGLKPGRKPGTARGPISGATEIELVERQARVLALRLAGANLRQIADEVGYYDAAGVHKVIMSALRTTLPDATRDELRSLEIARLDRLQQANWVAAMRGDDKAARVILACVKMRSDLQGLPAPQQIDVRVRQGELVRVDILEMLSDETMEALRPLQEEMVRLSEQRAGQTIDVDAEELDA